MNLTVRGATSDVGITTLALEGLNRKSKTDLIIYWWK